MNENRLTENEEKMLVLRFLLLLEGQKVSEHTLGSYLGWSDETAASTIALLQSKGLVFKRMVNIELKWEGQETARKILMECLFHTGTKTSWVTPSG